jgi:ArsR family transcriptional regulator, repressor of sdpIR and other operons
MRDVYRALGEPTRRRILALLRERDMTSGEIAAQFDVSWPTISGHLAVLKEADLVQVDRNGTSLTYHLNVSLLEEALLGLLETFRISTGDRS